MQLEFALDDAPRLVEPRPGQAVRRVLLSAGPLWYSFERARRKTLTIVVARGRVEVRAPRWTPNADIEAFIRAKESWIRRRLEEARREPPRFSWREGERLPVLGEALRLAVRHGPTGVRRANDRIEVQLAPGAGTPMLRASVLEWLFAEARRVFLERIRVYAPRMGVPEPELRLSNARTRWGSCSPAGRVLLNWRLIHVPLRLVDYVIAHELAHIRHLDHSRRFWALVERVYPDCRAARRELNRLEKLLPEI
jgi:predicted metal-dependent hydrolase